MSTFARKLQSVRRRQLAPKVPLLGLALFLLISLATSFPYFESIRSANEMPRLMQGIALVDDASFAIDGPRSRGLDPGPDISRAANKGLVPNKPPVTGLVAAIAYAVARPAMQAFNHTITLRDLTLWARLLGAWLPTVILCAWAWRRYAPREGAQPVLLAVVLYAVATPVASYAHLFYSHQLAACLLAIGIGYCIDGIDEQKLGKAMGGGMLAATAVATEYPAVFAAVPLGFVLLRHLARPRCWPALGGSVIGALLPIALLAAYHETVYDSPWTTGYHKAVDPIFAAKHAVGLLGLTAPTFEGVFTHLFSPQHGLLWWVPLFPFALYGLAQLALTTGPRAHEAQIHLAFFLILFVVGCGLTFQGGWRVGPRYLVVAFPALILGWSHAFRQMSTSWPWMATVMLLGVWSAIVNGLAATLWPHIDPTHVHFPVAEILVPLFKADYRPYGLVWWLGGNWGTWLSVGLGSLGVVIAVFRASDLGIRMLCAGAAAALLALYAVALSPTIAPAHPDGARNLSYIRSVYEPSPGSFAAGTTVQLGLSGENRPRVR
ncbi:MAG: hypothetical protein V3V08_24870 [Nannocystaceae bacterium]